MQDRELTAGQSTVTVGAYSTPFSDGPVSVAHADCESYGGDLESVRASCVTRCREGLGKCDDLQIAAESSSASKIDVAHQIISLTISETPPRDVRNGVLIQIEREQPYR